MPRGRHDIADILRAWKRANPGKWKAAQAKARETRASSAKSLSRRQGASVAARDVPVTLPRVSFVNHDDQG